MAKKSWSDQVEVNRPIAAVWQYIADPGTGPHWIKGLEKVEGGQGGPMATGGTFRATRRVGSRVTTEEIRVLESTAPSRFRVGAGLMGGGIELQMSYELSDLGGRTRVASLTEAETKSFGSRLYFGMFWKAVTENDSGNLLRLKANLETGP